MMNKTNNGNMVNSCYVDMGDAWVVIDSGPTYSYAKEAHSKIRKIKDQKIKYVINTHSHDDHWLGNGYYQSIGSTIVGSKVFSTEIAVHETPRMQNHITKAAYHLTTVTLPTHFIDKEKEVFTMGHNTMNIIPITRQAHSKGDLIIHFPELNLLFAGDLVFNDRLLSLHDGQINHWILALKFIDDMNVQTIVGGHGKKYNKAATGVSLSYLLDLKAAVLEALEADMGIDEAVKSITLPQYQNLKMFMSVHKQNVETAFRTLEWESE